MTLAEWIAARKRGAITELMRKTGLAYTTILYARDGTKKIGLETAKKIVAATDGAVTLAELGESVEAAE